MKKSTFCKLLLFYCLFLMLGSARAQYVAIPDVNFGDWLHSNGFSSCLTGNAVSGYNLDTTNTLVINATTVDCHYSNIHDLTGIQYFKNLISLYCYQDSLSSLPPLPATLHTLSFSQNQLTSLSPLPTSLTYLDCSYNQLPGLASLPASLTYLNCCSNPFTSLPPLPASLTFLACQNDRLTSLPTLPLSLRDLICSSNQLTSLPSLPATLDTLICDGNQLTTLPVLPPSLSILNCNQMVSAGFSLPALPASLTYLYCSSDHLTNLPALPAGLVLLSCPANNLTSIPALPVSLRELYCNINLLTSLPALPSHLQTLECGFNQISVLPSLPDSIIHLNCINNTAISCLPRIYQNSLVEFYIAGTNISCLPNRFSATNYDISPTTLPLCNPASGCEFYYNIAGTIHYDTAATCESDSLNPAQSVNQMKVQLKENGQVVQQFYSFNSGGYSFKTDSFVTYTVDIDTTGLPLSVVCPASGSRSVVLSATDTVEKYESFGLQCSSSDFSSLYIWADHLRPTFASHVSIGAGNLTLLNYNVDCGAGMPGTVTTTISGAAHYLSPAPGALSPSSISGNVLIYNLTDLDSLYTGQLNIIIATDSNAVVGSNVCITTDIESSTPDNNTGDNILTECFPIVNSWDPNEKSVYPLDTFDAGQWLTYTVGFQNTGTDTAYLVVVRDTLSPYVDASSFRYIASSAKVVIQLFSSAMVFTFPHINLVDSARNPALSTGWIQYKVKAKSNLPMGTQVKNTASIYFDNNAAVRTNTTVNTVSAPSGIGAISNSNAIHLYPNPNKGTFTLLTANNMGTTYSITDMLGKVVMEQRMTSNEQSIDMSEASEGVYTLTVKGATPIRFVVVR